ncbi:MAG: cobalt ECF transporter T component CbiQ [Candidatus Omnitrophica bacterium]|nr:cobalt ECF transporter T component CbiQ [Candidatus Omnitrophota bacterium]
MGGGVFKERFVEHSLSSFLAFLKDALLSEEVSLRRGFVQSLDPRIKILSFSFLIVAVLFSKSIPVLFCLYSLSIALACVSGIGLFFFLKRTWVFIPLFSLFIALPVLSGNFSPGEKLFALNLGHAAITVTREGVYVFVLFILRIAAMVSFAVLLNITTRHFSLLKALRVFKVPQAFVMVMGICYRYIYLFIGIIENALLSVKSRVGMVRNYKTGQRVAGWNIASLWIRSCRLSEEVYAAMLSRGYCGEPVLEESFRVKLKDWIWLLFTGGVLACGIKFSL